MMRKLPIFLAILLVASFCQGRASADDSPTSTPVKRVLTKIDATGSVGLCVSQLSDSLVLKNLQGITATSFIAEASTLKITPIVSVNYKKLNNVRVYQDAKQTWELTDNSGEGLKITNNTLQSLILVSKIDRAVTVKLNGSPTNIPGHSIIIINDPAPNDVLDCGSDWTAYYGRFTQKLPLVNKPTLVIISPNAEGIEDGLPVLDVGSIFDTTLTLRQE